MGFVGFLGGCGGTFIRDSVIDVVESLLLVITPQM